MLRRPLFLLIAFCGGAFTSQFPEFYQQYFQRLSGQLDQARLRVAEIRIDAAEYGLSIEDYIQRFLDSPDHALEGERMAQSFVLADKMEAAVDALANAPGWQRPMTLAEQFHAPTASATYKDFVPAVPLSPEGLGYGGLGAGLALLLSLLLRWGFRAVRPRAEEKAKGTP